MVGSQITALRQQQRAYAAQMADTRGASAAVFRDMQRGAERMAKEFRKLYLQTASRFAMLRTASFAIATMRRPEFCCREKDAGP